MTSNDSNKTKILADDEPIVKLPLPKIVFYLSIVWLLYLIDFAARFGMNPLYPLIQKELSLSDPQIGLLGSVILLGMALLVLPLSYLADRWSRSKLLSLMAIVWSICSIISGFAKSFSLLLFARGGLGVGEASFAPTATSLITGWFKKSQWGRVLGFFNSAASLGVFLGSIFSGYMAVTYGWRTTLIVMGIPGVILGLMALLIPDMKIRQQTASGEGKEVKLTVRSAASMMAKNKSMLLLVLFYGLTNMGMVAIFSWFPMYLIRFMGMSVPKAATLTGLFAVLGVVGFPLGGYLSDLLFKKDRRFRMWLPAIVALVISGLYVIGFYSKSLAILFLSGFLFTFINPSLNASSQELVPSWYRSVSMGIIIFGMQFIGMLGPFLTGLLSKSIGLMYALMCMQVTFLICFFGFLFIGSTYLQDYKRSRAEEAEAGI
jgi:predicted MFS family arabinose efflux permease